MEGKRLPARFFRTAAGNEPVREWLLDLDKAERTRIGEAIKLVEFGWPIGMPTCRPLGNGLYEVRATLSSRIARVLFCFHECGMVLLHGFIKKTEATPPTDMKLARERMGELSS